MAKIEVIVNPIAGAGKTHRLWPVIRSKLERLDLDFTFHFTENRGHAIELAKTAVLGGSTMLVAVGGDGTISEVANGIYYSGNSQSVKLGIISTGTGSDFIRTLGIDHNLEIACKNLVNARVQKTDAGLIKFLDDESVKERIFVNFAGLGFDADIVRATTITYKNLGAKGSYLLGLLSTVIFYHNQEIDLAIDGVGQRCKVCTVLMGNGKYAGGGMYTTPNASMTDGFFDVLIVGNLSKPDLLVSLPRIYNGTHLTHPKITIKQAKEVAITPVNRLSVQADGDLLGFSPVRFSILPAALNIIV